jgi:hypothetical protein
MTDHYFDLLWSDYATWPNPSLGGQTLHRTCSVFIKHILQPSDIILAGGGYVLQPELARPLGELISVMIQLIGAATKHCGLHTTSSLREEDVHVLTCTTGLRVPATQNQIIWHWVTLIDELYIAMADLKTLRCGYSVSEHPSQMLQILSSLPPALRAKLPKDFLHSYGFSTSPASLFDRVASIATTKLLDPRDIVDRGDDLDSHSDCTPLGRFGLDLDLLLSTKHTIDEMQALLTNFFACTHSRPVCFLVDPHGVLMQFLRSANDARELHTAWTNLSQRMSLAQERLEEYQQEHRARNGTQLPEVDPLEKLPSIASRSAAHVAKPVKRKDGLRAATTVKRHEFRPSVKTLVANIETALAAERKGAITEAGGRKTSKQSCGVATGVSPADSTPKSLDDSEPVRLPAPSLALDIPQISLSDVLERPGQLQVDEAVKGYGTSVPETPQRSVVPKGAAAKVEGLEDIAKFPVDIQDLGLLTSEGFSDQSSSDPTPPYPPGLVLTGNPRWMAWRAAEARRERSLTAALASTQHLLDVRSGSVGVSSTRGNGMRRKHLRLSEQSNTPQKLLRASSHPPRTSALATAFVYEAAAVEVGEHIESLHKMDQQVTVAERKPRTGGHPPSLQSPAPVLVVDETSVERGGLKYGIQSAEFSSTADDLRLTQSRQNRRARGSPALPPLLPHVLPAPELVVAVPSVDGPSAELGGQDEATSLDQQRVNSAEGHVLTLEWNTGALERPVPGPQYSPGIILAGDSGRTTRRVAEARLRSLAFHVAQRPAPAKSPAPAPASANAVELGGLEGPVMEQLRGGSDCIQRPSASSMECGGLKKKPSEQETSTSTSEIRTLAFALGAIVRTLETSHLSVPLGGEPAPHLEWEREGIGTCARI